MSIITPYIPPAVLRKNATGSYKMRISIAINPKFKLKRIQLGLTTKKRSVAEELSIAACRIFMQTGLCSRQHLRIIHETEREEFFLLRNVEESPQTISLSKNSTAPYDFHLPGEPLEKIPIYKESGEYKFSFFLVRGTSSDPVHLIVNTRKEKKKTAQLFATKIIRITEKAYSYTSPPIQVFWANRKTAIKNKGLTYLNPQRPLRF